MNKAFFLDRDGVINKEVNYLIDINQFSFFDDVFDVCRYFQEKKYLIIVITNQSGIARGYYSENDFQKLNAWMISEFKKNKIKINAVYHCPHHPDFGDKCKCRKPNIELILKAKKKFNLNLEDSILIGDKDSDIKTAINSSIGHKYLVSTGHKIVNSYNVKVLNSLKELLELSY
jgi:D-glycero-D-manno-heptose 1,7-bisphosphate phosphatase